MTQTFNTSKKVSSISICGAGWLGYPLACTLVDLGYTVSASTTSSSKLDVLTSSGISPFLFSIQPDDQDLLFSDFFKTDVLVITLPFKRSFESPDDYMKQISLLLSSTPEDTYVIFTSSTSIYSDTNDWVTEGTELTQLSARQDVLLDVETLILNRKGTVLRLAGLYGPNRLIGGFLRHVKQPKPGNVPVNLVHLDDVVSIITTLIKAPQPDSLFNVVSDCHPTRRELYTYHAEQQGFPTPEFDDSSPSHYKLVSNTRLKDVLGYNFKHPDPMVS